MQRLILACLFAVISLTSPVRAEFSLHPGPGVNERILATYQNAFSEFEAFVGKRLGVRNRNVVNVYISNDTGWLADRIIAEERLTAAYKPGKLRQYADIGGEAGQGWIAIVTKNVGNSKKDIFRIVSHEGFHTYQYAFAGRSARGYNTDTVGTAKMGPNWLIEGSAEYVAARFLESKRMGSVKRSFSGDERLARNSRSSHPNELENKGGMRNGTNSWSVSKASAYLLASKVGEKSLLGFWKGLGAGANWKTSFSKSYGMTVDQFYALYSKEYR